MSIRFIVAIFVFMMAQAMVFGAGAVLVLATPLSASAMHLMPWVVVLSIAVSLPLSWVLAPVFIMKFAGRPGLSFPMGIGRAPRS
jgi:hypothetical protein